ncbi:alkylated DNA repair protein alkB homolog 8 [Anopheles aquasalis]|uniref:alkylated DNA repair protein alkB homolog 8 n=1 Tax=Anopheles aquasalis TaxID=42839 RepID=UPI00215B5E3D|nr:alkylated DNA repair protein alkB homolog 8 [Anopheles aquasalis]XP_050098645.1 alkylated DNA repair protein alkB homolog 8 [Anopheles aquasalis]
MLGLSKGAAKKIGKKVKRCQLLIAKDAGIQFTEEPTEFLVVCNAGLSTGLEQERLLKEVLLHVGQVQAILMPPGKSYCYLRLASNGAAATVYNAMNGICPLGQDGAVLLLAFCCGFPCCLINPWNAPMPEGLILVRDFVDKQLEQELLSAVDFGVTLEDISEQKVTNALKNRKVKHYGYEFLYGTNNVDKTKPLLDHKIPSACDGLWEKLRASHPNLCWHVPDQMTVNQYEPGQGIPAHVDTHSAFEDPILSLSLGSDIVMEFKHAASGRQAFVDLPARSLLIMSGESRYIWTHGITPRKLDTILVPDGSGLTIRKRQRRISLTFRKLRLSERCDCAFSDCCDSKKRTTFAHQADLLETHAALVEAENVHRVYNQIAKHFSDTRHSPWPRVEAFLQTLNVGDVLLDVGCGNGKYLGSNSSAFMLGCDRSDGLLQVCADRGFNVLQCDCLALPVRDGSADACISIAVLHHLATKARRRRAISEMIRVLRTGGRALIYVWAKNQEENAKKSSYLRQNKQNNKPKPVENPEQQTVASSIAAVECVAGMPECTLPVHTNRTPFQHQDLLVPWKLRTESNEEAEKQTFLRFYHVFEKNELEQVCLDSGDNNVQIVESFYDQGNWCVVMEKM